MCKYSSLSFIVQPLCRNSERASVCVESASLCKKRLTLEKADKRIV